LSDIERRLDLDSVRSALEAIRGRQQFDFVGVVIERGDIFAELRFDEIPAPLCPV